MRQKLDAFLAEDDFTALATVARDAKRRGDAQAPARIADHLFGWLEGHWRERPLPRIAELLERLGPARQTEQGRALAERARHEKAIDDATWFAALRSDDERFSRDLDAILAALHRAQTRDVMARVAELATRCDAQHRDPRVAACFVRWLEAPPLRATSTQPMWNRVFSILDTVGDPRTLAALRVLVDKPFPSGAAMAGWMAQQLSRALARFEARNTAGQLDALLGPAAEGALAAQLDDAAALVVALIGGDFVASGGEAQGRALEALLAVPKAPVVRKTARRPTLSTVGYPWQRRLRIVAASDDRQILVATDLRHSGEAPLDPSFFVFTADGRHLAYVHGDEIAGVGLARDGSVLAVHRGNSLTLVDTTSGARSEIRLVEDGEDLLYEKPRGVGATFADAPLVTFDRDSRTLYALVLVSAYAYPHTLYEAQARIEKFTIDLSPQGPVVRSRERWTTVEVDHQVPERYVARPTVRTVVMGALALSPDGRRMVMMAPLGRSHERQLYVFDHETRQILQACVAPEFNSKRRYSRYGRYDVLRWVDDTHFVFAIDDEQASLIEADTLYAAPKPIRWPEAAPLPHDLSLPHVDAIATAPVTTRIAATEHLDLVQFYDLATGGTHLGSVNIGNKGDFGGALALLPEGDGVIGARMPTILGRRLGVKKDLYKIKSHKDRVRNLWLSADGSRLVSAAFDAVRVWQLPEALCLLDVRAHATFEAHGELHPGGELLLSWDPERVVLTALDGGQELARLEPNERIGGCALAADGHSVLLALGPRLERWSPLDDSRRVLATRDAPITALAREPDGVRWAIADASGRVALGTGFDDPPALLELVPRTSRQVRQLAFAAGAYLVVPSGYHGARGAITIVELGTEQEA